MCACRESLSLSFSLSISPSLWLQSTHSSRLGMAWEEPSPLVSWLYLSLSSEGLSDTPTTWAIAENTWLVWSSCSTQRQREKTEDNVRGRRRYCWAHCISHLPSKRLLVRPLLWKVLLSSLEGYSDTCIVCDCHVRPESVQLHSRVRPCRVLVM